MGLKNGVNFKMSLRLHVALFFFLLQVMPLVTLGVLPSTSCSDTEWKLPDPNKNSIPNFSRVGYRQGHVQIPIFPVKKTLKPVKAPDDDTIRIQKAIDEVGALPSIPLGRDDIMVRGAVLLEKGLYRVGGSLIINKPGVVLRGEGPDALSGTTLLGTEERQGDFIQINAGLESSAAWLRTGPEYGIMMNNYRPPANPGTRIREGVYIPVGTTILSVIDTSDFNVDQKIVVELPGSNEWLQDIGMNGSWTPSMVKFKFERTIVDIDRSEHTLTIDNPMVMSIDPQYPQHAAKIYNLTHRTPMVWDVGIENLRLVHRQSSMHAVKIDNAIHGWMSDVSVSGFKLGIEASLFSSFITIQNCEVDHRGVAVTKGVKKGFALNGQTSLVNNCTTVDAFQDFTSIGPVCGPNVFVDSRGINSSSPTGPRDLWVMGSLYDNIFSGNFSALNRRRSGPEPELIEPGWMGAFNVFYNCKAENRDSKFESAPGTTNWIIGFQDLPTDYYEWWGLSRIVCPNMTAEPRSLYWSQLAERTGKNTEELMRMNGAETRDYSTAEDAGNTPTTTQVDTRRPSTLRRICRHIGKRLSK